MKTLVAALFVLSSFHSYGYSVVDTMYEQDELELSLEFERTPASNVSGFCLMDDDNRVFAKSCYKKLERCEKRLEFWKDLPGVKPTKCDKV